MFIADSFLATRYSVAVMTTVRKRYMIVNMQPRLRLFSVSSHTARGPPSSRRTSPSTVRGAHEYGDVTFALTPAGRPALPIAAHHARGTAARRRSGVTPATVPLRSQIALGTAENFVSP